jgi:hypothetical protein
MQNPVLLAIVVLILLVLLWSGNVWAQGLAVAGLGVLALDIQSDKPVLGAGWGCSDGSQPFGSRCAEIPDGYPEKKECELRCLTADEKKVTAANIKKFLIDRGINFPVPEAFLAKLSGADYFRFRDRKLINMVSYYINSAPDSCKILLPQLLGNHATYAGEIGCYFLNPRQATLIGLTGVKEPINDTDKIHHARLSAYLSKLGGDDYYDNMLTDAITDTGYARYLASIATSRQTTRNLLGAQETLAVITRLNPHGLEYVSLSRHGTYAHANAIVINHDTKQIFHFEPSVNISRRYTPLRAVLDVICMYKTHDGRAPLLSYDIKRLEYEKYTPDKALQVAFKENDDIYCQTWELLGGVMYAINARQHSISDTFAYMLSLNGKQQFDLLQVFAYYLYDLIKVMPVHPATISEIQRIQNELKSIQDNVNDLISEIPNDSPRYALLYRVGEVIDAIDGSTLQDYANTGFADNIAAINRNVIRCAQIALLESEQKPDQGYDQLTDFAKDLTGVFNSHETLFQFKERFRQVKRNAFAQGTCTLV